MKKLGLTFILTFILMGFVVNLECLRATLHVRDVYITLIQLLDE